RALRRLGAAPLAHLEGEAAQDLPDRDAEPLALHHCPYERTDRRSGAAIEHVRERLKRRQAHALLLERDPELVAERPLHPLAGDLERGGEAEARLDGDDEQVDQLRHVVVDFGEPLCRTAANEEGGTKPADRDGDEEAADRETRVARPAGKG